MLKLFSVYDSKVGAYLNVMTMRSAGEALRAFGAAAADPNHEFYKYAEDYTLFEIGEWDETLGKIIPHPAARSVIKAIECSRAHSEFYFSVKSGDSKAA